MKLKEQALELVVVSVVVIMLVISAILCTSCATTLHGGVDSDPAIFNVCLETCMDRYSNCTGTKHYQRISPKVIGCTCITARGDFRIYYNYTEYEVEGSTSVNEIED